MNTSHICVCRWTPPGTRPEDRRCSVHDAEIIERDSWGYVR